MNSVPVAVISPQDVVRLGIQSALIRQSCDTSHSETYRTVKQFLAHVSADWPGVVILDDDVSGLMSVQEVLGVLAERLRFAHVIVIGKFMSEGYITRLLSWGAQGFIYTGDQLPESLLVGIRTVRDGHAYLSPRASAIPYSKSEGALNETDVDVLRLLAQGYGIEQITGKMSMAKRSIYRSRSRIREYLNVRNNDQIVDEARRRGLLD